jgi:hypothetical protein
MLARRTVGVLGTVLIGTSLVGSPALARCGHDCRKAITSDFKTCKSSCEKGTAGKDCRKACRTDKKARIDTCKRAVSPTPPQCGETSITTTTTTLHGTTTLHVTTTTSHPTTT